MKSVLFVNKFFAPDFGGVESVVQQYADFAKSEYKITVLCCSSKFSLFTKIQYVDSIKVVRCSSLGTFFSMPVSLSFIFYFFKECFKADLIHAHYPFPLFDLLSCFIVRKKKVVLTWHSDIVRQDKLKKLFKPFTKYLVRYCYTTTTSLYLRENSEFLKNEAAVRVLPLSTNYFESYEKVHIDLFGRELPKNFILFQGRLSSYKGIQVLLDSYLFMVHIHGTLKVPNLVISGDGELLDYVISFIEKNKLKQIVFPLGRFVSNAEKSWLFKNCTYFVFPSTFPSEAFGIVQLEAMSEAKPVINTNLQSGVPWVSVNRLTGLTVEPNSVEELANAIILLHQKPELVSTYGQNAKKRFHDLFQDDIAKQNYLSLLEELI